MPCVWRKMNAITVDLYDFCLHYWKLVGNNVDNIQSISLSEGYNAECTLGL